MYKYRLHYLWGEGDGNPKTYHSDTPVEVGDIIQPDDGFYHQVTQVLKQKTGVRLDLSKSCQSAYEAELVREQLRDRLKY